MDTESIASALEIVRRSRWHPTDAARLMRDHASAMAGQRPAASRLAARLADAIADLGSMNVWPSSDDLGEEVNHVLRLASEQRTWPATLGTLRSSADVLEQEHMIPVLAWHADLASRGVPREANGAAMVICLGSVLGGTGRARACQAWARQLELENRLQSAERYFARGAKLMEQAGDAEERAQAAMAVHSFRRRHGIASSFGGTALKDDDGTEIYSIPGRESRAYDLRDSGRLDEALALLDETIALCQQYRVDPSEMRLRILRGLVYEDLGEFELGEQDYEEAGRLAKGLGDDARAFEAGNNAAASLLKRGASLRAITAFTAILRRADVSGAINHRIAARNNLALAYSKHGDHVRARALYAEALNLIDAAGWSPSRTISLQGLARALQDEGDTEGARAMTTLLLTNWLETGDEQALVAFVTAEHADLMDPEIGELARTLWRQALDYGNVLNVLALTYALTLRGPASTEPESALQIMDTVLTRYESMRSAPYAIGVEVSAAKLELGDLGRIEAGRRRLREAIERVEERLATVTSIRELDRMLEAARPLYLALADHLLSGEPDQGCIMEAFWLHEVCRPATLTTTINRGDGATTGVRETVRRNSSSEAVRAALAAEDRAIAVVSFMETEDALVAFVIRGDGEGAEYQRLKVTPAEVRAVAGELSSAFNGDLSVFPPRRPASPDRLGDLELDSFWNLMDRLSEVTALLDGVELVCLVPSRSLEALPLHAMRARTGRCLVEDAGVCYAASVNALVGMMPQRTTPARGEEIFFAGVAALEDAHPESFEEDLQLLQSAGRQVSSAMGSEATPSRVLKGLRHADIAHITCHGYVDRRDPLGSGLLLAHGTQRPSKRLQAVPPFERSKYLLTVRQLVAESFETSLLALRACSTARLSTGAAKDELRTLTRVLQLGGCRTVVSALWNVDQESSLALLRTFYEGYLELGFPAWKALADAQRHFINSQGPRSHIYHWGPFMVSGDWRR